MKNLAQESFKRYNFLIIGIFLAGLVGFITASGNMKLLILFCLGCLAIVIAVRPFFGLILSIPLVMWFSYTDLLWISAWNYILAFLIYLCILILVKKQKIKINKYSQRILIIFILFIFLTIIVNWINGIPFNSTLLNTGSLISVLLLGFCTMFFIKSEKQLIIFLYCLIGFMSISALVGIGQFLNIDFFWKLREIIAMTPEHISSQQILYRSNILGLALYSIPFGYQLTSIAPLNFGVLINKRHKSFFKRINLSLTFVFCFSALLFTLNRSAILGGIIGVLVIIFMNYSSMRLRKLISLIIIFIFLLLILNMLTDNIVVNRFLFSKIKTGMLPRELSVLRAIDVVFSHPFGIGRGNPSYMNYLENSGIFFGGYIGEYSGVKIISPHNQFINIFLYYGFLGLFLLVLFYYYIFKGLFYLYRNNNAFIRGVTTGLIGSFSAYIINSMFHNDGPFLGDPLNWYFVGVVMFLLNNYEKLSENGDNIAATKN